MTPYPYQQIADVLRAEIRAGRWPAGRKLDTRRRLAHRFGVSEMTVNNAIRELEQDGLLVRKQGKGVYVVEPERRALRTGTEDADTGMVVRVEALERHVEAGFSEIYSRLGDIEQRLD